MSAPYGTTDFPTNIKYAMIAKGIKPKDVPAPKAAKKDEKKAGGDPKSQQVRSVHLTPFCHVQLRSERVFWCCMNV